MAQTIKRGGKGVRRATAARSAQRKVQTARQQTGSVLDSVLRWLPFSEETLHRILMTLILAAAAGLVWTVAVMAGIPALVSEQAAIIASDAGFKVSHLEVRGVNRMNEAKIYERILGQNDRAMTTLDLAALRDELNQLPWVKDARVSRKLPDTLVIDIVERTPHAVLRKPDRMVLIDDTGVELESVRADRAKGMLVLSGMGVGQRVEDLTRLLDAAPALKPQVSEAEWVGNRRWNLTFKTGQVLALPEGDETAASALLSFARMDGVNRLLGGKVAAFDMRAPDRIYMRVPGHADEVAAEKRAEEQARAEAKRAASAKSDEG
ncbi:cell division protein FtsQ [Novosphingobium aromaticivorans DSM 12444]|uniref:Cell division protein FtsQ n=1 Tax=Novosphingobium aromaticivorans (strain ATCC 700278 / DSM 12444 / CCUG 56034 / CIP 105152 / NBRC 16084 / F199) TaxID=279238 RepID=FTSQ_NOVAD|nr:FtsQ-type POTRA domain-containing protein [Novosphingobium aromaticivorans]Q2G991.1 RecName: Full=Cell division protein FtsQ [Novosphingobium aromaticivorans DSM 12444]ABD25582.1 cell division protein FtsQ [Novosphingobium aromaticivorans DSM 12444]SCX97773.1 cell division protein FtsQ [Novosphingobium aromaticivorans]